MLYISTVEELVALLQAPDPLVVGCYADWCPASSMAKPVFERVAAAHAPIRFCKVRTDMSPRVAALLRVEVIPSFYFLCAGELVDVLQGAASEPALSAWLRELVSRSKVHVS